MLPVLVLATAASAAVLPCPGGRFVVEGPRGVDRIQPGTEVVVEDGTVALGLVCPPVPVRQVVARQGDRMRATWPECGEGRYGRTTFRARFGSTCWTLAGVTRDASAKYARRFIARRMAECGNGLREGAEACDDGNTLDGDCCSATCEVEPATGCLRTCSTNADCTSDELCLTADADCGGQGTCTQRPAACRMIPKASVCACDRFVYRSACEANASGTSLGPAGTCGRRRALPRRAPR